MQAQYNRNALLGAERAGESLIALTRTGHLLKFDLATLKLRAERICAPGYRCIGRGPGGSVLAAREDGAVDEIDQRTLSGRYITTLPGIPTWIGTDPTRNSIVAALAQWVKVERWERLQTCQAWDVAAQKAYDLPRDGNGGSSAFFVDRAGKMWIGADHGEWGGWCYRLDLASGSLTKLGGDVENIYGFCQLRDGTLIAYGGMMHFSARAYMAKAIDGSRLGLIYQQDSYSYQRTGIKPAAPYAPISHIVQDPSSRELIVFAFSDVYAVNPSLSDWRQIATLNLGYAPGRPDAMGAYPAVASVILTPGDPRRLICATQQDGLVEIRGSSIAAHTLPDQVPFLDIPAVLGATRDGTVVGSSTANGSYDLFLIGHDRKPKPFKLTPPIEPAPGAQTGWSRSAVVRCDETAMIMLFELGYLPGESCLVEWRGSDPPRVISRQTINLSGRDILQTPDGRFWEAGFRTLKRLEGGEWKELSPLPNMSGYSRLIATTGRQPWLGISGSDTFLLKEPAVGPPTIVPLQLRSPDGKVVKVNDGVALVNGVVVLATDAGILRFVSEDEPLAFTAFPQLPDTPKHLCLDRLGRLWAAGKKLWLVDSSGWKSIEEIPSMRSAEIRSIGAWEEDGIVALLNDGAVVTVSSPAGPAVSPAAR